MSKLDTWDSIKLQPTINPVKPLVSRLHGVDNQASQLLSGMGFVLEYGRLTRTTPFKNKNKNPYFSFSPAVIKCEYPT
ncbi:hypothetical protein STEG23_003068, partial [Scotinomys teguina]